MPWSAGTYTRGYPSWVNDASANLPISATKFDTEDNDFATGLNNCLTIDGLNKPNTALSWSQALTLSPPAATAALTLNGVSSADALDINETFTSGANWAININGSINGDARCINLTNGSTGTSAETIGLVINNDGTAAMLLGKSGAHFSGTKFTGGPSGEISFVWSGGTIPLVIACGTSAVASFLATGSTLYAPSSGNTLTINGVSSGACLNLVSAGTTAPLSFANVGSSLQAMSIGNNYSSTGSAVPTLSSNKPGGANSVIGWLNVFMQGTQGWIPIFGN